ncbi:MAG: glycoside hydrolase family 3 N-terminal domain-containing protein [Acidimicrobiales bacterium]
MTLRSRVWQWAPAWLAALVGAAVVVAGLVGATPKTTPLVRPRPVTLGDAAARLGCATVDVISRWPLSQRLSELLMVGVSFGEAGLSSYASAGVGGLYFLGQPAAGSGPAITAQLRRLDADESAAGRTLPFLATDEEGGGVARLANVLGPLPWERQQAAMWTPAQLQVAMARHAAGMRALGFTMDLAPVLDTAPAGDSIGAEGLRSYSENGPTAASYALAAVHGLQSGGVVPVLKHFPGLGHANANTDASAATDPSLTQLQGNDLVPFERAIDAGAPVVMVSHAMVPGLTHGLPASLSPQTYAYLRGALGFTGLAITDSLGARAVSAAGYSQATAAVAAVSAGADMVLVDGAFFGPALAALTQAVESGALPLARVDAAVGRILTAKGISDCPSLAVARR